MIPLGQVYFYICAGLAVLGALATVAGKNPIRCAMGLLLMILAIAGLFLALHAQFLAIIQLIVYAGAIVVLFLFVIMLLGPSATSPRDSRGLYARAFGGGLFALASAGAIFLIVRGGRPAVLKDLDIEFGSVDAFGRELFTKGVVPFELSSALLMVAVLGAIAVARGKTLTTKADAQGIEGHKSLTARVQKSVTADLPGVSKEHS
jgi:NADH-quinone oxidoreductase subunit J